MHTCFYCYIYCMLNVHMVYNLVARQYRWYSKHSNLHAHIENCSSLIIIPNAILLVLSSKFSSAARALACKCIADFHVNLYDDYQLNHHLQHFLLIYNTIGFIMTNNGAIYVRKGMKRKISAHTWLQFGLFNSKPKSCPAIQLCMQTYIQISYNYGVWLLSIIINVACTQ